MNYTTQILAIVCPACQAAVTARCLDKVKDGIKWRPVPHVERVEIAESK